MIQDFTGSQIHGMLFTTFTVLNHRVFSTNWDLYTHWLGIKSFLVSANTAGLSQLSFWTGNTWSFPYFVASGKSSPSNGSPLLATGLTTPGFKSSYPDFPRVACFIGICTIAFQGVNNLGFNYIGSKGISYLGIVFTDFIGDNVIQKAIGMNSGKFVKCTDIQLGQGCTYCSITLVCLGCNTTQHYSYNTATKSCDAENGYYLKIINSTNNVPELCSVALIGCLTCLSSLSCTQCDAFSNYALFNQTCVAAPGYYLNALSLPTRCTLIGCDQCSSATVCTVCSTASNYIMSISNSTCYCDPAKYFVQAPSVSACICMTGYFLSQNNTCDPIHLCPAVNSGCFICDTPNQVCLQCFSN